MLNALNQLPVATLIALAAIVGGLIALANGDIDYQEYMIGIGAASAGAGVLGSARVQAAKSDTNKVTE